jgi:16S rRNA (adenine1518-N6/adenine1519-N6)-dimethyltransferase
MLSPKRLLNTSDLRAKKSLGQNFLTDLSTAKMIVEKSHLEPDDMVLEIGAGLGALTIPVAKTVRHVHAVEKDSSLVPILENQLSSSHVTNVTILNQNILNLNFKELFEKSGKKFIVMGNLPYNISSQVLVYLLKNRHFVKEATLMFQKELAERISAPPGSKDYGRLSVMLQYCATVKTLTDIKANVFFPRPKVDSSVIKVRFHEQLHFPASDEKFLFDVIKAAFGKRRKTLKNALSQSQLPLKSQEVLTSLEISGIDPFRRAETLSVEEFVQLANMLWKFTDQNSSFLE